MKSFNVYAYNHLMYQNIKTIQEARRIAKRFHGGHYNVKITR